MWKIFGVKTLYRTIAINEPKKADKYYRENLDLIEERIVTIKARNFDEAIAKGEKEAIKYASKTEYVNPYGQNVKQSYIGSIDAYELYDKCEVNIEVYSTTYLIQKSITDAKFTDNIMGKIYKNEIKIRAKFFNREFSGMI